MLSLPQLSKVTVELRSPLLDLALHDRILAAMHSDFDKGDGIDFVDYVVQLAERRPHEWAGNGRELTLKWLNQIIDKYQT